MGEVGRQWEEARLAGLLHDLGNVAVPERVLAQTASPSADDARAIQSHVTAGFNILSHTAWPRDLRSLPQITAAHHELVNGAGYPKGLAGDCIPLPARMIAAAAFVLVLTTFANTLGARLSGVLSPFPLFTVAATRKHTATKRPPDTLAYLGAPRAPGPPGDAKSRSSPSV